MHRALSQTVGSVCAWTLRTFIPFTAPAPSSSSGLAGEKWGWTHLRYSLSFESICRLQCQESAANAVLLVRFPVWHLTSSLVWATGVVLPKGDHLITVFLPPLLWSGCKTACCWTWAIPRNWVSEIFKRAIYLGIRPRGFLHSCLYNSEATKYFHSK